RRFQVGSWITCRDSIYRVVSWLQWVVPMTSSPLRVVRANCPEMPAPRGSASADHPCLPHWISAIKS
ncbi:hypothetical protein BDU57DRAFT_452296, partial [Ampelomyces quisqualis]